MNMELKTEQLRKDQTPSRDLAATMVNAMLAANQTQRVELYEVAEGYLAAALQKWQDELVERTVEALTLAPLPIYVVLDGPPGPVSGRFVEVENETGQSVRAGEWIERADGYWALRIDPAQGSNPASEPLRVTQAELDAHKAEKDAAYNQDSMEQFKVRQRQRELEGYEIT